MSIILSASFTCTCINMYLHVLIYINTYINVLGALNSPINKKKTPMTWVEIKSLIVDLRVELGLIPSNIPPCQ
jgi:hypothetical protein